MGLYQDLFGKDDPVDASVTDFAEHGRVGGVDTGQGFKFVTPIDGAAPTEGNNSPLELGYNAADQLVRIRKTINSVVYVKLITGTDIVDSVVASVKTFGTWGV